MHSLRARVAAASLGKVHRLDFHQLICVTEGGCTHAIDFEPIHCEPGTVLLHRPSQTQQYDTSSPWDGWHLLFRSEFLLGPLAQSRGVGSAEADLIGILEGLPCHLVLPQAEFRIVSAALAQVQADSVREAPLAQVHALLRHQLSALLIRLHLASQDAARPLAAAAEQVRFRRFQQLLESSFHDWHQVADYANVLGCTERTLTRTTQRMAGVTAKAFIAARISLEAKRLLAHTALSVVDISDRLGFDDPSNFTKFFKRVTGGLPLALRRQHQAV